MKDNLLEIGRYVEKIMCHLKEWEVTINWINRQPSDIAKIKKVLPPNKQCFCYLHFIGCSTWRLINNFPHLIPAIFILLEQRLMKGENNDSTL